jgi:hypothetical protein
MNSIAWDFFPRKVGFAKRLVTNQGQSYRGHCYPARLAELVKREWPIQAIEMLPKDSRSSETGYSFGRFN